MSLSDTAGRYGLVSVANHWLAAAAMVALFVIAQMFEDLPRGPERQALVGLHLSLGTLAALYLLFRVAWRARAGFPPTLAAGWQDRAARLIHRLLLADIVVLAITGPLIVWTVGRGLPVFGLFEVPSPLPKLVPLHDALEVVHKLAAKPVLLPLLALHVLGALKHAAMDRDGTLRRILWPA